MAALALSAGAAAPARVLVVDDHADIREPLAEYLEAQGLEVFLAADGRDMRRVLDASVIDLVVLDVMLPYESGWDLCAEVTGQRGIPVIMLTAMVEVADRIHGLGLGADDYLTKPFAPGELLARIQTVLRRVRRPQPQSQPQALEEGAAAASGADGASPAWRYDFEGWVLDVRRYELCDPVGQRVTLNSAEFRLLCVLAANPNQVLTRERLLQLTHGDESPQVFDRSIDTAVSRLRRKLEARSDGRRLIKTAWGNGYVFAVEVRAVTG